MNGLICKLQRILRKIKVTDMLRHLFIATLFFGLFSLFCNAQSPHQRAVDIPSALASKIKDNPKQYLPELVQYLTNGISSDEEKTRIIHDWTALNIRYDVEGFFGNGKIVYDTYDVIKTGKSVCEGYCNVMEMLLTQAGIENKKISGYARGYGFNLFAEGEKFENNHAWTAVKLGGKWQLIDVTWNSGFVDGINFVPHYTLGYYHLEPEKFIHTHFPEAPEWQLLSAPIPFEKFIDMPYLTERFFALGFELITKPARSYTSGSKFDLELKIANDALFMATLYDSDGNEIDHSALAQRSSGKGTIHTIFPKAGKYKLTLFAKHKGEKGNYFGVADFAINASDGMNGEFPVLFKKFVENSCRIINPLTSPFTKQADGTVNFEFFAPVDEAGVESGEELTMLTKNGAGNFAGKVKINQYPVRIFMKVGNMLQYICSWEAK